MTRSVMVEISIAGIMTSKFLKNADMMSLDVNATGNLSACGDTDGNLRFYRYPCSMGGVGVYLFILARCKSWQII